MGPVFTSKAQISEIWQKWSRRTGRSHTLQIPDRRPGFPLADTVVAPGRSRTQLTKQNKTTILTLTIICPTLTSSQYLNPHLDGKGQTLDSEMWSENCISQSHINKNMHRHPQENVILFRVSTWDATWGGYLRVFFFFIHADIHHGCAAMSESRADQ